MADKFDIGFFNVGADCVDLVIEDGDLKADNSFETAVLISMFTDRFTEIEDLPAGNTDPRGWWADLLSKPLTDLIGSRLWTLDRAKTDNDLEASLEEFAREALNWMLEDGIADRLEILATKISLDHTDVAVKIFKPDGSDIAFQFVWDGQELNVGAA